MPAQRVHVPSRFPRLGPATPGPTALCQATSTPPRTCHGAGTLCRACLHFRRRMRPADGYRQPRGPVKGGPATWLRAVRFFAHGVARRAPQTSTPGCHHVHYPSLKGAGGCRLPGLPPSGGVHCSTPQSTTAATGGEGGGEEEEEKKNAEEGEVNTGYSYAMGAAGACG